MILGAYTIADLVDLIAAKTVEVRAVDTSLSRIGPDWQTRDASNYSSFINDWNALKTRWQSALDTANTAITVSKFNPLPASTIYADNEYHGILNALAPGGDTVTSGDMTDLNQRLLVAGGQGATSVPQPTATDWDLKTFQATDAATTAMPGFVKTFVATVAPGIVPQNKDTPNYNPIPKWKLYAGAAAAGLVAIFVLKRR